MDKAAEEVRNAINNGIDLIREGAGIQATLITFIVQILATLVLFLFVRIFLWKTVTGLLDKRKQAEVDAINEKDQLLKENQELKEEAKTIIDSSRLEAQKEHDLIIQNANQEHDAIITEANQKAQKLKEDAERDIEQQYKQAEDQIKEQIVTVAYDLSRKITNEEIDSKMNDEIIDNFFKEQQND